jgi:hypothetical protein
MEFFRNRNTRTPAASPDLVCDPGNVSLMALYELLRFVKDRLLNSVDHSRKMRRPGAKSKSHAPSG